jgi:hypothetical protein
MCVNRENVSEQDLAAFATFIEKLSPGPLKEFLEPMYEAISEGGGICLGIMPGGMPPGDDSDDPPSPLPPGIYPPPV